MGMFDQLRCRYPLPVTEAQNLLFQTKDTPAQWLDYYEIREDGTLWREDYDLEDTRTEQAKAAGDFRGCMAKVNKRWEPMPDFVGEIRFYTFLDEDQQKGWVEFSSYFANGRLLHLHVIEHRENWHAP